MMPQWIYPLYMAWSNEPCTVQYQDYERYMLLFYISVQPIQGMFMLGFIDYLSKMALASMDENGSHSNSMQQSLAQWDRDLYN